MEKTTLPLSWKKQPYPYPRRGQPMLYWNTTTYSIIMEDTTLSWKKQSSPYPRKGPTVTFFSSATKETASALMLYCISTTFSIIIEECCES
jgi:hypothetical protein